MMGRVSQPVLDLLPAGACSVGPSAGLLEGPDGGVVFVFGLATFSYAAGDETGRRLAAVQLAATKIAPAVEVASAFGVSVATATFGSMSKGFYGLRATLLTGVFLALLREPRAEGATRIAPADLGRVLGLDRAPEVKTLRRKLAELAAAGQGAALQAALAAHHAATRPGAVGFLYLDGHVRVYTGTRQLPKTHIARMRIAGPATEETWPRRRWC